MQYMQCKSAILALYFTQKNNLPYSGWQIYSKATFQQKQDLLGVKLSRKRHSCLHVHKGRGQQTKFLMAIAMKGGGGLGALNVFSQMFF